MDAKSQDSKNDNIPKEQSWEDKNPGEYSSSKRRADLDSEIRDSSDDEFHDAKDDEREYDDESMAEFHKDKTDEELEKLKEDAVTLKDEGNECFKKAQHEEAIKIYTRGLNTCPLKFSSDRAVLYANRAASKINLDMKKEALIDCNEALKLNPSYMKALVRRAQLHRKLNNLDESLADYKKILELDRNNAEARSACAVLPGEIQERNEKLKEEMFGKLKDLGNLCLRPFGLSTDNFKVVQDPNTGGYSVNFQQ